MKITCNTDRGLSGGKFTDKNGSECSVQDSSTGGRAAIWLGVDVPFNDPDGDYTRMHLDRPLVRRILKRFTQFLDTGKTRTIYFNDLYGSKCEVRKVDGGIEVGAITPFDHPDRGQIPMTLDADLVRQLVPVLERFVETGGVHRYEFDPADFYFKPMAEFPELAEFLGTNSFVKVVTRSNPHYWYMACRQFGQPGPRPARPPGDDRWTFVNGAYTTPTEERPTPDNSNPSVCYSGCVTSNDFANDLLIHLLGTTTNEGTLKHGKERLGQKDV